jgi:hypothetical protein
MSREFGSTSEVAPGGWGLHVFENILRNGHLSVDSNLQNVVLMHAVGYLVVPNGGATNEVGAVTFTHQQVTSLEPKSCHFGIGNLYVLELRQIQLSSLDVGDS